MTVQVRFHDGLRGEWTAEGISCWADEGTLEFTVSPPERDPEPETSPWEGMAGAAVWVGDRIVGVIAKHHRSDGLGRLAAARLDLSPHQP